MTAHSADDRNGRGRKVLVIEDEGLLRTMLSEALKAEGFAVWQVPDAASAAREFDVIDPDAILCDIDLGSGVGGLDLIAALTKRSPHLGVVILSNYEVTADYRERWLADARYLRKTDVTDPQMVVSALDAVMTGSKEGAGVSAKEAAELLAALTPTQVQVLRLVAEGYSNTAIAEQRASSVGAVEHVLNRTFAALGLGNDSSRNLRVMAARIYLEGAGRPSSERA